MKINTRLNIKQSLAAAFVLPFVTALVLCLLALACVVLWPFAIWPIYVGLRSSKEVANPDASVQ